MTEGKLPKAILFDMDGTILAYNVPDHDVWRGLCSIFAPRLRGIEPDVLAEAIKQHRSWSWSDPERHRRGRLNPGVARLDVVTGGMLRVGLEAPALAREMADAHALRRDRQLQPIDGSLDVLDRLRRRGVRLGLVTNGAAESQRRKIDRFKLDSFFEHILIEGEFGLGKPDDRVYLHVLDRLDSSPRDAWMVGDHLEWEVAVPQRLGMFAIWVDAERQGLPEDCAVVPDRTIETLTELI